MFKDSQLSVLYLLFLSFSLIPGSGFYQIINKNICGSYNRNPCFDKNVDFDSQDAIWSIMAVALLQVGTVKLVNSA